MHKLKHVHGIQGLSFLFTLIIAIFDY